MTMWRQTLARTGICFLLAGWVLPAQPPSNSRPSFEVASIKRAAAVSGPIKGEPEGSVSVSGSTLSMRNVTLRDMIRTAYALKDHQLSGPAWLKSGRYDVAAKSAAPATMDQRRLMLQGLLADRFKLEIHRESKDLAVTGLVVGKNGPKLGKAKPEGPVAIGIEHGKMMFQNYSMEKLADYLTQHSGGRTVVDATGIEGYYDFAVGVLDTPSDNPIDVKKAIGMGSRDGSLAKTIVEEIGLRLDARKGAVEIVVVDRAERAPEEN